MTKRISRALAPGVLVRARNWHGDGWDPKSHGYTISYGLVLSRSACGHPPEDVGMDAVVPVAIAERLHRIERCPPSEDSLDAALEGIFEEEAVRAGDPVDAKIITIRRDAGPHDMDGLDIQWRPEWYAREDLRVVSACGALTDWAQAARKKEQERRSRMEAALALGEANAAAATAAGYRQHRAGYAALRKGRVVFHPRHPTEGADYRPHITITLPRYTEAALRAIAALVRKLSKPEAT